jgi:hypothetical protein
LDSLDAVVDTPDHCHDGDVGGLLVHDDDHDDDDDEEFDDEEESTTGVGEALFHHGPAAALVLDETSTGPPQGGGFFMSNWYAASACSSPEPNDSSKPSGPAIRLVLDADWYNACRICSLVQAGRAAQSLAATPETKAVAMDVPDRVE